MPELTREDLGRAAYEMGRSNAPWLTCEWNELFGEHQGNWKKIALASPLFDVLRRCQERLCADKCMQWVYEGGVEVKKHCPECIEARAVLALREEKP